MTKFTDEQRAAIEREGNIIVSASAGSGKTSVMIEKLVNAVADGVDLDDVLAVTFTKKAAGQIKDKLRSALIRRVENADELTRARLKVQLSRIPSADISTIHALCARLLRTYFYALDIDGGFDIISADDAQAKELKARAIDALFERYYKEDDPDFKLLLCCFRKKRSDDSLKRLLSSAHSAVRSAAHYEEILNRAEEFYNDEGFERVCFELQAVHAQRYEGLKNAVADFAATFVVGEGMGAYGAIFGEMIERLESCENSDIFEPQPPLSTSKKPRDKEEDKPAGERYKAFREDLAKKYKAVRGDLCDRETERLRFMKSGEVAKAFSRCLLAFDGEYTAVKREENKLDYNDLEHLTLRLLSDESVRRQLNEKYRYVYVDEYQDVNPVQEEILSKIGGQVFLVGDVKQAIYGFRGSKSLFFAEKYAAFLDGEGTALRLSRNFRSSDGVIGFVNSLFSDVMRRDTCGFDYAGNSEMRPGGLYPPGDGSATIHIFGKEERVREQLAVYSVREDRRRTKHSREGLAVLSVVKKELQSTRYDLIAGDYVPVQPGDICILTRKNKGPSVEGIVRALEDAGYPVSGAQEENICNLPEVRQMLDILSLVDNAEQDLPLVTALLSPLGNFSEDELGAVRIAFKGKNERNWTFRQCCEEYRTRMRGVLAEKLNAFYEKLNGLRDLANLLPTGELVDKILSDSGLEARYSADGGEKLRNVLRLSAEGADLPLAAFLRKIKAGGNHISAPAAAPADSIKVMTMHASKGLEFPVVILADLCRTFSGGEVADILFDEKFGFAPKCYDEQTMTTSNTVVRRLCKARADREELKNELNLFYVACTRAMCRLHLMAEEIREYSVWNAATARCYADTFDMSRFPTEEIAVSENEKTENAARTLFFAPQEQSVQGLSAHFMQPYAHAESIDLPVKSSASAILKLTDQEPAYRTHELFGGEGETGVERGIAYHRFLELCDFSAVSVQAVEQEIENFVQSGRMTREQAAMLVPEELAEILSMPVFGGLDGAQLFREQEFLCRLPANEILDTVATDGVLIQGAIDLLARGERGWKIIDYKYSGKSDQELVSFYRRQLELYRKATALITGDSEQSISMTIVNIFRRRQIDL